MFALLRTFSLQELLHHPWRAACALLAVVLGVALGFAVHVINASALDEFSRAVRNVQGQPDLELRAMQGALPEQVYGLIAGQHRFVAQAAPWLEATVQAQRGDGGRPAVTLRVLGGDALQIAPLAPALMPRLFPGQDRLDLFAPATVFLNAAALQALGLSESQAAGAQLRWQLPPSSSAPAARVSAVVRVAGTVAAGGLPLAVMDIGAAQDLLARS